MKITLLLCASAWLFSLSVYFLFSTISNFNNVFVDFHFLMLSENDLLLRGFYIASAYFLFALIPFFILRYVASKLNYGGSNATN